MCPIATTVVTLLVFFKSCCNGNLGSDFSDGLDVVSYFFRLQGMGLPSFQKHTSSLPLPFLSLFARGVGFVCREYRCDLGKPIFAGGHVFCGGTLFNWRGRFLENATASFEQGP